MVRGRGRDNCVCQIPIYSKVKVTYPLALSSSATSLFSLPPTAKMQDYEHNGEKNGGYTQPGYKTLDTFSKHSILMSTC